MASNNPSDSVTSLLRASSGGGPLTSISEQLQTLQAINEALMQQSAAAVAGASTGDSGAGSTSSSVLDAMGGVLGGGLGGGLGLSSMISGLTSLFGGGDTASAPPSLTPYVRPLPIQLDAGFSDANGGSAFGVDAAQGGMPRALTGSAAPAQITVQVQALESQSFLDHSNEIAMAVRQAMLETTVLNDVIREV